MSEIRVSEIRMSKIRGSEIRVSKIRVSEIRISSNHRELHGAIFFRTGRGLAESAPGVRLRAGWGVGLHRSAPSQTQLDQHGTLHCLCPMVTLLHSQTRCTLGSLGAPCMQHGLRTRSMRVGASLSLRVHSRKLRWSSASRTVYVHVTV